MKIVINATGAVGGGSITYLLNILPALAKLQKGHKYIVLLSCHQYRLSLDLPNEFSIKEVAFPTPSVIWRLIWEQLLLPLWLYREKADVLYAPSDIAPLFAPCSVVLAVRNPNPYTKSHSSLRRSWKFTLQRLMTRLSAFRAKKVIFVSNNSRDSILTQIRIPYKKTEVVYHGIDHSRFGLEREFKSIPLHFRKRVEKLPPYVLCVSTINPHKNYETLFRGWAMLRAEIRDVSKLVVAGICVIPSYFGKLEMLIEKLGIKDEIVFLGEVPYLRMPYLYRCASAFVFPSALETFGHPLVEAMAMGLPIVSAASTCIPEIVDGAALLFETTNPVELSRNLEIILTDQRLRNGLVEKGMARSIKFSWVRTASITLDILESVSRESL